MIEIPVTLICDYPECTRGADGKPARVTTVVRLSDKTRFFTDFDDGLGRELNQLFTDEAVVPDGWKIRFGFVHCSTSHCEEGTAWQRR